MDDIIARFRLETIEAQNDLTTVSLQVDTFNNKLEDLTKRVKKNIEANVSISKEQVVKLQSQADLYELMLKKVVKLQKEETKLKRLTIAGDGSPKNITEIDTSSSTIKTLKDEILQLREGVGKEIRDSYLGSVREELKLITETGEELAKDFVEASRIITKARSLLDDGKIKQVEFDLIKKAIDGFQSVQAKLIKNNESAARDASGVIGLGQQADSAGFVNSLTEVTSIKEVEKVRREEKQKNIEQIRKVEVESREAAESLSEMGNETEGSSKALEQLLDFSELTSIAFNGLTSRFQFASFLLGKMRIVLGFVAQGFSVFTGIGKRIDDGLLPTVEKLQAYLATFSESTEKTSSVKNSIIDFSDKVVGSLKNIKENIPKIATKINPKNWLFNKETVKDTKDTADATGDVAGAVDGYEKVTFLASIATRAWNFAVTRLNTSFKVLKGSLKAVGITALIALVTGLTEALRTSDEFSNKFEKNFTNVGKGALSTAKKFFVTTFNTIKNANPTTVFQELIAGLKDADLTGTFKGVVDAANNVTDLKQSVADLNNELLGLQTNSLKTIADLERTLDSSGSDRVEKAIALVSLTRIRIDLLEDEKRIAEQQVQIAKDNISSALATDDNAELKRALLEAQNRVASLEVQITDVSEARRKRFRAITGTSDQSVGLDRTQLEGFDNLNIAGAIKKVEDQRRQIENLVAAGETGTITFDQLSEEVGLSERKVKILQTEQRIREATTKVQKNQLSIELEKIDQINLEGNERLESIQRVRVLEAQNRELEKDYAIDQANNAIERYKIDIEFYEKEFDLIDTNDKILDKQAAKEEKALEIRGKTNELQLEQIDNQLILAKGDELRTSELNLQRLQILAQQAAQDDNAEAAAKYTEEIRRAKNEAEGLRGVYNALTDGDNFGIIRSLISSVQTDINLEVGGDQDRQKIQELYDNLNVLKERLNVAQEQGIDNYERELALIKEITEIRSKAELPQIKDAKVNVAVAEADLREAQDVVADVREAVIADARAQGADGSGFGVNLEAFGDENIERLLAASKRYAEAQANLQAADQILQESEAKLTQASRDVYIETFASIAEQAYQLTGLLNAQELERYNYAIDLQEKRVDKAARYAEEGSAKQLQVEEERLDKILEEREDFQNKQQALQKVQAQADIAITTAQTIAQLQLLVAKSSATSLFSAPIIVPTLLAIVGAIMGTVSNLFTPPSLYEGIESTGFGGRADYRGGFHAVLHPFERVVERKENEKLLKMGVKNNELAHYVEMGKNLETIRTTTEDRRNLTTEDRRNLTTEDRRNLTTENRRNLTTENRRNLTTENRRNLTTRNLTTEDRRNLEIRRYSEIADYVERVTDVTRMPAAVNIESFLAKNVPLNFIRPDIVYNNHSNYTELVDSNKKMVSGIKTLTKQNYKLMELLSESGTDVYFDKNGIRKMSKTAMRKEKRKMMRI